MRSSHRHFKGTTGAYLCCPLRSVMNGAAHATSHNAGGPFAQNLVRRSNCPCPDSIVRDCTTAANDHRPRRRGRRNRTAVRRHRADRRQHCRHHHRQKTDAIARRTDGALQLSVRRIGFKRRVVDVAADRNAVDVSLERDALKLEELVITGQGTAVARQNLANDVASVDAEALTKVQTTSFEGALQGKIPGANIQMNSGAPGGGGQVQIRGITSINGSSDPLWVVDGVIVSNDVLQSGHHRRHTLVGACSPCNQDNGVNRIADLNLNDIERIEVLKGASASSIYGATRGERRHRHHDEARPARAHRTSTSRSAPARTSSCAR